MRLRCIRTTYGVDNVTFYNDLTVGKYYDIIEVDDIGYKVLNDIGYKGWVMKNYFESIENMRDNKLNEIGI